MTMPVGRTVRVEKLLNRQGTENRPTPHFLHETKAVAVSRKQ